MARPLVPEVALDSIAWKILEALQQNARISFAELGRQVGLSTPAAAERVKRLEEAGIIAGYHALVDPERLGIPICVYMRLTIAGGEVPMNRAVGVVRQLSEVVECHRVTGTDSFILRAGVVSVRHLEMLIDRLSTLGTTSTATVLSSPVKRREYSAKQLDGFRKYQRE